MGYSTIIFSLALLPLTGVFASIPKPQEILERITRDRIIRVRLAEAAPKVAIRGFDLRLYAGGGGEPVRADRRSEWELRCQGGRVRAVRTDVPGATASTDAIDLAEPVRIETPAGFLFFRGRPYRQSITVRTLGSFCEAVNELDIEKYLDGLVNAEFSSSWPAPAVAAQVVAARTYAVHQMIRMRRNPSSTYDVDASVSDQVYDGSIKEDSRASQSVLKTKGLVLVAPDGGKIPIKAFYHSTCGGRTELPEKVWGMCESGFKRSVKCPFCGASPRIKWSAELAADDVRDALLRSDGGAGGTLFWPASWRKIIRTGKLMDVRALPYAGEKAQLDGRVATVVTSWSHAGVLHEIRFPAARLRDWAGPQKIRSTAFSVSRSRVRGGFGAWRFDGRGNGHGVGMCQWGAKTMGERGFAMQDILKHYYPDAMLRKAW